MANILDYLDWRGDLSFSQSPFNQVDNLLLSVLSYTDMKEILTESFNDTITLAELYRRYSELGRDQSRQACDPRPALEAAAASPRYHDMRVCGYADLTDTDRQVQFSAVSFYPGDGSVCAVYRGTDNSIVGWREDFNMSYLSHTPGQQAAADYLDKLAASTDLPIRICGHSKGGNFAIYAALFSKTAAEHPERILHVCSNDGPGFNAAVADTADYSHLLDKLELFVPESSLIGVLLKHKVEEQVIDSSAVGIQQHNPYTWQVLGPAFVKAPRRTVPSLLMDETLGKWLSGLDNTQRQHFVDAIFDALEGSGVSTLSELNANWPVTYNAVLKAAMSLDDEVQRDAVSALKSLAATGTDILKSEARRVLDRWEAERKGRDQSDL